MSQLDVDGMRSWSRDECAARSLDVLPRLVQIITASGNAEKSLQALELSCQKFLPTLPFDSLESVFLHKVLPHLDLFFGSIAASIKSKINASDIQCAKQFQHLFVILDSFELCVTNCAAIAKQDIPLGCYYSLPVPVLKTAVRSFELFGECKCITVDVALEKLSDQLNSLFNKTTSLLKSFMSLWEKSKISVTVEKDVQVLLDVCRLMNDVIRVFSAVAEKSPIALWKAYVSTLVKHCDGIKDRVDVAATIELLCENVQQILREIPTLASPACPLAKEQEARFVHSLQVCGFCLRIITTLCEKFKTFLGDCFRSLLRLVLRVYQLCPPSLLWPKFTEAVEKEVERNLGAVIEPLLSRLVLEPQFIAALQSESQKQDRENDFRFAWCRLLLFVLEHATQLPAEPQQSLPSSEASPLRNFFDAFANCCVELCLPVRFPGVMCHGKPQRMVSFYEHVCTRLCGHVAALPASHFPSLERILVDQLLSGRLWSSLLACDVWTFLGRLESPQLCFYHCCCIAEVAALGPPSELSGALVELLLRRLFEILADEHKTQFLSRYPPAGNRLVWRHLFASPAWDGAHDTRLLDTVAKQLLRELDGFVSWTREAGQLSEMTLCLDTLCRVARSKRLVATETGRSMADACLRLWMFGPLHLLTRKRDSEVAALVAALVAWTACLLPIMQNRELVEVLTRMLYVQGRGSDSVELAVYETVNRLGPKAVPSTDEQARILSAIALLLTTCLRDSNAVLAHRGLETFAGFSYVTRHESVVARCLRAKPQAREAVKRFLNKVPHGLPLKYSDALAVLRAQEETADLKTVEDAAASGAARPDAGPVHPQDEGALEEAAALLEVGVARMTAAVQTLPPLPPWLTDKVRAAMDKLADVLRRDLDR